MTNKQKNILSFIGFAIIIWICYEFAIVKTLALKKEFNLLSKNILLHKNTPKQLSILKQKNVYYDNLLAKYQIDGSSIQNNLLKYINTFADSNAIKIVYFNKPHVINKNDLSIKTYDFKIQGDYNSVNRLIYQLEQHTKFGEVVNLHFEKVKNFKTGKFYLQCRVLFRSFG